MYTQKKPIENVHIVRERDRQRFRELLAVFALGLPIGLFLLLFTWQNLEVIRLGHEATRLQETRKQIEEENKRLQFELDRLTALESVEQRAVTLGFAPADPKAIVMVKGDGGKPQPIRRSEVSTGQAGLPVVHKRQAASPVAHRP
jgi:cell division protein FtsL